MANFQIQKFLNVKDADADDRLKNLLPSLLACASNAFSDHNSAEDIRQHKLHMVGDQVLVASNNNGKILGYCAASILSPQKQFDNNQLSNEPGVYIASIAVHHDAQGKGLSRELIRENIMFGLNQAVRCVFLRTQNPRVGESIKHTLNEFVQSERIKNLTGTFTLQQGVYHGMLTADKPVARNTDYSELDYANGDAYLMSYQFAVAHT
jgi:GNAT superfamily N-acetyltransferase